MEVNIENMALELDWGAEQAWRYYDFDSNWSHFHDAWLCDDVQDVLAPSMIRWCDTQAYFNSDGTKPVWKPKSDLWQYSRTDFHCQRMLDRANARVEQDRMIQKYGEARERAGTPVVDQELLEKSFWDSGAFEALEETCQPQPDSLEAHVLFMGANFLAEAQAEAGKILFPGHDTEIWLDEEGDREVAVVPSKKLILDFTRYFLWQNGAGCKDLAPQTLMTGLHPEREDDWEYELE